MSTRRTLLSALLIVALTAATAGAYGLFTAEDVDRCSQCHTDWPEAGHTVHDAFGCTDCHVDGVGEGPVPVSSCAVCHPADGMLELHGPLEAPNNDYCGYCHTSVDAESRSFSDLKQLFD
jgi:hypothetical protein